MKKRHFKIPYRFVSSKQTIKSNNNNPKAKVTLLLPLQSKNRKMTHQEKNRIWATQTIKKRNKRQKSRLLTGDERRGQYQRGTARS